MRSLDIRELDTSYVTEYITVNYITDHTFNQVICKLRTIPCESNLHILIRPCDGFSHSYFTPLRQVIYRDCFCGRWLLESLDMSSASSSLQHVLWSDSGDANRKHTVLWSVCVLSVCTCRWWFCNTAHECSALHVNHNCFFFAAHKPVFEMKMFYCVQCHKTSFLCLE